MQKLLVSVCLSVVTIVFAADSIAADRSGGVSVGRDGASVSGRGGSASASREGASVSGRGGSVSASREGTHVSGRGGSVSASREGASVGGGASVAGGSADGVDGSRSSGGYVNAAGDRSYDNLESWISDLKSLWSGEPAREDVRKVPSSASSSRSSSIGQVSKASATSTGDEPAVAESRNVNSTEQN
jgi:hypothetical protein